MVEREVAGEALAEVLEHLEVLRGVAAAAEMLAFMIRKGHEELVLEAGVGDLVATVVRERADAIGRAFGRARPAAPGPGR